MLGAVLATLLKLAAPNRLPVQEAGLDLASLLLVICPRRLGLLHSGVLLKTDLYT